MKAPRSFTLSENAKGDLLSIHEYIARENPIAADELLKRFSQKISWIAETRFPGVPRETYSKGLKALPFGRYAIYFRIISGDHLFISRILHGSRAIGPDEFESLDS